MKQLEITGHIYVDSSARDPIMHVPVDGSGYPNKIQSLERIIRNANIFDKIESRFEDKTSPWTGMTYPIKKPVTVEWARKKAKKLKVTITVEEV